MSINEDVTYFLVNSVKYRKFGKLNWKVSVLGFGAMRLPIIGGDARAVSTGNPNKEIDERVNLYVFQTRISTEKLDADECYDKRISLCAG
jgi:hypothetical protein